MGKKKKKIPVRSIIVAIIFFSIAVYFISVCWEGLKQEYVENEWKVVTGKILNPEITLEGKKNIERKNQGMEQLVNYEYEIDGRIYRSNAISKNALVNVKDYNEGESVAVYYNPIDKTDSVLIRTRVQTQYLYAMMFFCVVVIFVIFYSLIRDFKNAFK